MVSFCKKGAIKKKSLLPLFSIKYTTFYWEIINLLYSEGLRNVLFINCLLYDCFSSQENKRAGKVWKDILDFIGISPPEPRCEKIFGFLLQILLLQRKEYTMYIHQRTYMNILFAPVPTVALFLLRATKTTTAIYSVEGNEIL